MSNASQTFRGTATLVLATNKKITNLSLTTASTEYSHALQDSLRQVIIKCRGDGDLKLSFTSGESGTKFITIPKGAVLSLDEINFSSTTLYLQSSKASQIAEILELY